MVRVALTGGIATGKSTVVGLLQARDIPTIDADVLARDLVAPGSPGLGAVVERFGEGVLDSQGALDRKALAALVFNDPEARRDLERIVHPGVYAAIGHWFGGLPSQTRYAVADIPLLFESGHRLDFDRIVVVACPPDEQLRRVMTRNGVSESDARARLDAQWPIAQKVALADDVIWTTGTRAETERQVDELVRRLKAEG
ncbi:MAG: dephospho-CoA kinase [Vicinamibacteria bacterium]|nr:dephospho-CoA kinase [Vicinamibacteria bacterium]